jgi:acetolactate synthase-1/3 small subunit
MNMTYLLDVANHTGVVTRISLIFRRHGANLQSLSTAKTEHPGVVRIVITSEIDRRPAERIQGQLAKLIDIFKVDMISHEEGTFRAFGMVKIACTFHTRPQILQLLEIFNGRVLELTTEWVLVEMTGTPQQLEGLMQVLQPYGILEAVETGPIVIRHHSPPRARQEPTSEVLSKELAGATS